MTLQRISLIFGCVTAAVLAPLSAMAVELVVVTLRDQTFDLPVSSCRTGEGYYLIDAASSGMNLSLVGALTGDQTYTTIDFFFTEDGESKRAGASVNAIPLEDGAFAYEGPVDVSDGKTETMRVQMNGC